MRSASWCKLIGHYAGHCHSFTANKWFTYSLRNVEIPSKGAATFWLPKVNNSALHSQTGSVVGPFLPGSCQIWNTGHECSPSLATHINSASTHHSYASHLWEKASVNLSMLVVSIKCWKFCTFGYVFCFIRAIAVVYCADSCQQWQASPAEAPLWLIGGGEEGWSGTEEGNDSDSTGACVLPIIPVRKCRFRHINYSYCGPLCFWCSALFPAKEPLRLTGKKWNRH